MVTLNTRVNRSESDSPHRGDGYILVSPFRLEKLNTVSIVPFSLLLCVREIYSVQNAKTALILIVCLHTLRIRVRCRGNRSYRDFNAC